MLRSRFFWKLYAGYAALVLTTSVVIGVLVHLRLEADLEEEIEAGLRDMATMLSSEAVRGLRAADGGDIQERVEELEEIRERVEELGGDTGVRITLVRPDGRVIADSDEDPGAMENHGDRPEIREARAQGWGLSRRYSRTLDVPLLYVARELREGGDALGVLRLSIPLDAVQERVRSLRATIAFGAVVGIVVAAALGLVVTRRIIAPIAEIESVARDLGRGDYERRVRSRSRDEIGVLATNLDRLADELTRRIATLARERAQLGAMVTGMQEGVVAVDEEDRVVFANDAARRLLSRPGSRLRDRPLWEAVRHPGLNDLVAAVRSRHTVERRELTLHRAGAEIFVDARATPFSTGEDEGVVVVLYDITDLRRLERIRTEFVANVSHELKTPLTSIRGYVETLLGGAIHDDDNNLRFLRKIEEKAERLDALVSDLLELARIESPTTVIASETVDWRPLLEDAVRRHADAFEDKELGCSIEDTGAPAAIGDTEAMRQVVDNLLDNAIAYTPSGGRIVLRLGGEDGAVRLDVEDTGVGIPRDRLDRVFERFYRVDEAHSGRTEGTGLGLSIVKHLVQRMGGEVRVESELARGSRFTVLLPAVEPAASS